MSSMRGRPWVGPAIFLLGAFSFLGAWGILAVAAGCAPGEDKAEARRPVSFRAADGVPLGGVMYGHARGNPPGLVLVHEATLDHTAWAGVGEYLARRGFLVLALDLRGHGGSGMPRGKAGAAEFDSGDWLGAVADIEAAYKALLDAGADPENMGVIGAGLGANLALHALRDIAGLHMAVLVSPGLDYEGVETMPVLRAMRKKPVLLMTSAGDAYAEAACSALKAEAPGFCELRTFRGAAHGADLFAANPSAMAQLLQWFELTLREK